MVKRMAMNQIGTSILDFKSSKKGFKPFLIETYNTNLKFIFKVATLLLKAPKL